MKTIRTNSPVAGQRWTVFALAAAGLLGGTSAVSAASLKGQVLGSGEPVAQSTVTLWAASAGAPKQLAQARTDAQGRFSLTLEGGYNLTGLTEGVRACLEVLEGATPPTIAAPGKGERAVMEAIRAHTPHIL